MLITPLTYRARRLLRGGRRHLIRDVASESWTICRASDQSQRLPPAIALDGQFDRVTGLSHSGKTFERERALLGGRWPEPRETTAIRLRNATLLGGYLYCGPAKETVAPFDEILAKRGRPRKVEQGALGCTVTGNTTFSHWMTDNLTLELLAAEFGEVVVSQHTPFGHAAGYRELLGSMTEPSDMVEFDELVVFDDVAQNEHKWKRYETLRARLAQQPGDRSGHGVMILRGSTGNPRVLANEMEVADHLSARGFTIVDPKDLTPREIVRAIRGASLVLGVEGSTMAHGLFSLGDSGTILMLQPPYRFNALYKEYADCLGMRFAYVVGLPDPMGFRIDIGELDSTLDLVDQTA